MKHLFLPYKLALLAKEKGFDEPCLALYIDPKRFEYVFAPDIGAEEPSCNSELGIETFVLTPLYQQLVDWFREKHDIEIYCLKQIEENEYGGIVGWSGIEEYSTKSCDADYYKALNKTLEEAFKLIP